jgi:hypothetical protein
MGRGALKGAVQGAQDGMLSGMVMGGIGAAALKRFRLCLFANRQEKVTRHCLIFLLSGGIISGKR